MWRAGEDPQYAAIRRFYGDRRARRSGVRLIDHIDQGLAVLDAIGATVAARQAFCLHPIVQADADLLSGITLLEGLAPRAVALAMEYRSVANEYLSTRVVASHAEVRLSPLAEVNDMLIADKVQNRKDFERYHARTHPRAAELAAYYRTWLARLGITEERYAELAAACASSSS